MGSMGYTATIISEDVKCPRANCNGILRESKFSNWARCHTCRTSYRKNKEGVYQYVPYGC
ncbi:MAG: Cys-rich, Zn-binding UPF0434 family protein [Lokiarchaeia virus VerdaV1]|uniref:Cys-rich, Zn-binding UPF0434 family protein n=1 Tax=Lokiarchaeia virus VerdaV1 TaxID=3070170 RepID=A0AA35CPG3_9CAUD|nr:MAG: Cys-rich, Zn-binding UPF0434 family protein [Lokiarchaeia virus VerdaV1]BDI54879.1 MAG: Cys-rich, Zn-binding UPF0434 family protein [Lokiarchaeia virus VerdaV1]